MYINASASARVVAVPFLPWHPVKEMARRKSNNMERTVCFNFLQYKIYKDRDSFESSSLKQANTNLSSSNSGLAKLFSEI